MARLSLALLGSFQATLDGKPITEFATDKVRALLAYLAVEAGRPHRREALARLLWPDWPDASALTNLHNALSNLRQALGDRETAAPVVLADRETVRFNSASDAWVDAQAFRALTGPHQPIDCLEQGIALYRGPFLEGFSLKDSAAFEEWLQVVREQLQRQCLAALARLAELYEQRGDLDRACQVAWRQLDLAAWQEETHRQLMRLLALTGQRGAALAQYETCRHILQTELGVGPAPETVALYERIRDGTFPDRAVAQASAPLSSASPIAHPHHNLPAQLSSFIGREKEVAQVKQKLTDCRLVTLTGAGGCGKTRLALRVASDLLNHYADGVCWVDLAPLVDATLLPQAIAKALNTAEQPDRTSLDVILDFLHAKCLVLVLDNCEHLASACAEFAHDVLCDAPQVNILATSREPLAVIGEMLYPVAPLALPPKSQATEIAAFDSIRLFVERARSVLPNFKLTTANAQSVADICRRLDGIPLAIELASARVSALTVEQIAARLDDRFALLTSARHGVPSHHRTLRAALDWSYDSLSTQEQTLLRRLSVFAGGCSLEAAESVCSDQSTDRRLLITDNVLDMLTSLVNKSLVVAETLRPGEARYRMLETIRQYARDRLMESNEVEAIRNRHLDYFLRFAEEVAPRLHAPEQTKWLDRLDSDHDNLRAALEWSLGEGRVERGLRLAAALMWFWEMRAYWTEARQRVKTLLNQPEAAPRTLARANALLVVVSMGGWGGVNKPERPSAEELIAIAREHGAEGKRALAFGLAQLSHMIFYDDIPGAISLIDEGLDAASSLRDEWLVAYLLMLRGFYSTFGKDYGAAFKALEQSLTRFTSLGDKHWATLVRGLIIFVYYQQGDWARARQEFERYSPFLRDLKDRGRLVVVLGWLGDIARASDKYDLAKKYDAEFLEIARQIGDKGKIADAAHGLGFVSLYENDLNSARLLFAESLALQRELNLSTLHVAEGLFGFACLAAAEKQARRAVRLFAATECLFRDKDASRADEAEYKRYLALARKQLDEATFHAAWEEGKAMTLEQAITEAEQETVTPSPAPAPALPRDPNALTPRETEVLRLVAAGLSDAQVAANLVISRRTVSTHLTAIYGKLGVNSRSAATRCALDRKLV